MNWRSRADQLQLGVATLVLLGVGSFLYVQIFVHRSPVDTSYASHVHSLLVERNGTLVLGDHNSLWSWRPADRTWRRYAAPLDRLMPFCLAVLPHQTMLACTADPSTQAVSNPRGMWRSTDGGQSWRRIAVPDLDVLAVATNHFLPRTVFIMAQADSQNGGLGHGGIYRSLDGGQTWRRVQLGLGEEALQAMALVGTDAFRVLVSTADGVWAGDAAGTRWTQLTGPENTDLALAPSPTRAGMLYAGTYAGLWVSRDLGQRWAALLRGGSVTAVAPTGQPDDVYLVRNNHVYGSVAGKTISGIGLPSGAPGALAADPSNPLRAYAAYSFPLRVYQTTDGGRSWHQIL